MRIYCQGFETLKAIHFYTNFDQKLFELFLMTDKNNNFRDTFHIYSK